MEKSVGQQLLDALIEIKDRPSQLAETEPYLLQSLDSACLGVIPENEDYRIEDLSDDDLDVPIHVA